MEKGPTKNPLDVVKGREQEIGPLLGIFIILILFLLGGSYFLVYELKGNSKKSPTATTTEIIIYRHPTTATSTGAIATSTGNAELDAIQNSLDSQTQNINGLNF
jgi:hypothetical protein